MIGLPWRCVGHPNAPEIHTLRDLVPTLDGDALARLALSWQDTSPATAARTAAFGFDVPGVVDLLATVDGLDELCAAAQALRLLPRATAGLIPTWMTDLAFGALTDVVAAAYARPVLSDDAYGLLHSPWQALSA